MLIAQSIVNQYPIMPQAGAENIYIGGLTGDGTWPSATRSRFMSRQDAGTIFSLSKGKHTLVLMADQHGRKTHVVLDKVLITNDLSHVPPGKRFIP